MVSLLEFCQQLGFDKTFWVAYSGGADSHLLLHLLARLSQHCPLKLKAIHIHHGLSPHADQWAQHCQHVCAELHVDFLFRKITVNAESGESKEAIARQCRYTVFADLMTENDVLFTAHHQDDQAETVLLQLLRGAGPKGLASMPRIKPLGKGLHARPFLDDTREELQHYAKEARLSWVEDESNRNVDFSRNFLRHQLVPILKQRWPTVAKTLARVADNCADAQQVLDSVIQQDLASVVSTNVNALSVAKLKQFSPQRQCLILREWLHQHHYPAPPVRKMQRILIDMLSARADKSPHIHWGKVELRRFSGDLYLMPYRVFPEVSAPLLWNLSQPLSIPHLGILKAVRSQGQGIKATIKEVTVRFRQGGEHCRLPGRPFHHALKNLFQQWAVPPWERDRVPLIYVGDELAMVVGFVVCDGFAAVGEEEGFEIKVN